MTEQCPCNPKVTKRVYWLRILLFALLFSIKCAGQSPMSIIVLPDTHETYAYDLNLIGRQLHVLLSHAVDCPELNDTCMLHGKMTFAKFFAPLEARGLTYQFKPDTIRQSTMLIIKRALPTPLRQRMFVLWTTDDSGNALPGVNVRNIATGEKKQSDVSGVVSFRYTTFPVDVFCSYVGRRSVQRTVLKDSMAIPLAVDPQSLDAAMVSLTSTTKAVTTSSYSTVVDHASSYPYGGNHELSGISTATVQTMLEGHMPGVLTTQTSGMTGSSSYLSVRGQGSMANGIDPLYVLDGVPAAGGNISLGNIQSGNAAGSVNSWTFIAPANIERIDVLRDADATAMYGSRGANGVVLVTTRHWHAGAPILDLEVSTSTSKVTNRLPFMNTRDYSGMRREALQNSGDSVNVFTAPDLTMLDTSRNFDWGKWLLGRTAQNLNIKLGVSGGVKDNNYTVGMDYLKEVTPLPTRPGHDRIATHYNYGHRSLDGRWTLQVSGLAGWDVNRQCINLDPTALCTLAPDAPPTLNPYGQLNFPGGLFYPNPLALIRQPYEALSHNYLLSLVSNYALSNHFVFKATTGFNTLQTREYGEMPVADQDPALSPVAAGFFSTTNLRNRIFEPQLEYRAQYGNLCVNWIGGTSLQWWDEHATAQTDTGYASDVPLLQHHHAVPLDASSLGAREMYKGFYTSFNANWNDEYILSVSGRRDGSSRFPVNERFGNFGSVAFAWVFSDTRFFNRLFPFVSYGKVKVSEGVTGNNQISDRTLQNFAGTSIQSFQSIAGLYPSNAPGAGWEKTYKRELSLDLGFWQNRVLFNATTYQHYCDNLFLNGDFPMTRASMGGMALPAVLENWGYELSVSATLVDKSYFGWEVALNWTVPKSKLASFPGLNKSIYAGRLVVGQSINILRGYVFKGVDSQSGLFTFADLNGDGKITDADEKVVGRFDVTGFGGFENTIRWRHFQFGLLIDARIATGLNYLAPIIANNPPGTDAAGLSSNEPRVLLDHWRRAGGRAAYQRIYADPDVNSDSTRALYLNSSALLANTSFLRLRRLSISYELPAARAAAMGLSSLSVFADAQNLFVVTPYRADPEIQSVLTMPTMRTVEVGVRLMR